jgi:hypothetical protein
MKRIAVKVFLFLLLGAIVNIAVAWMLATTYIDGVQTSQRQDGAAALRGWPVTVPES